MKDASLNRRNFARVLVASAASAPLVLQSQPGSAGETQDEQPVPARKPEQPKSDGPQRSQADLLLELIQQRYPDKRLDGEVLAAIREDIQGDLARSRVLSSHPLENSDEPAFVFAAYRSDD